MSENTKIEWADHTWSPWRGCTKVSPGCANCYAETLSHRNPAVMGEWGPNGKRVVNVDWKKPLAWDRAAAKAGLRRRVFPSLCDVFEDRPDLDEPLARFFRLVHATPNLDWLVLTKRPELWMDRVWAATRMARDVYGCDLWIDWLDGWGNGNSPFPNLWLGTSVEDQARADERIPHLLQIPAAVRWLSVEPLIGPVDLTPYFGPQNDGQWMNTVECGHPWHAYGASWVVIGGESGPHARPCDLAWIRSIRDQCQAAGVPVFVKQLGARPVWGKHDWQHNRKLIDTKGGDIAEFPPDLRVREFSAIVAKGGAA